MNTPALSAGLAAIGLAVILPWATAQELVLNEGDSVGLHFNSLAFFAPNTNVSSSAQVGILFMPGLESGESIQVEFFADSGLQGSPFYTGSFTSPLTYADNIGWVQPSAEWDDLDGGVRVTMLHGSAPMRGVQFQVHRLGETFSGFQPVPEPRLAGLAALGVTAWWFKSRRRQPHGVGRP